MLEEAGITAYIPPQPNMRRTDHGHAARQRCKSPNGVGAAVDRITHGEGAIAELKRHGAGRARCRGTRKVQIQLLLAATAINLKRLITRSSAAENAANGDDHRHTAPIAADNTDHAHRTEIAAHLQIIRPASTPSAPSTPPTHPLLRQAPSGSGPCARTDRIPGPA